MPQEIALAAGLFNAFLWGSWAVLIKKLRDYPLDAYFIALYIVSFALVWAIALLVMGGEVFSEIGQVWRMRPAIVYGALLAGATYIVGMRIMITVFSSIGLTVTAPIQTLANLVLGTSLAAAVGGMPASISVLDLAVVCLIFLAASFTTIWAGEARDRARLSTAPLLEARNLTASNRAALARNIALVCLSSVLVTAYPLGLSFSLKTPSNDLGLTPLPYSALLVCGSLVSALLLSGAVLTRRGQWSLLFRAGWRAQRYSVLTAGAHYGGNVINAYATGALTTAVSWPLGTTSQLWTYLWGLAAGEFKGAPRKSYLLIAVSAVLFLAGIGYLRLALAG